MNSGEDKSKPHIKFPKAQIWRTRHSFKWKILSISHLLVVINRSNFQPERLSHRQTDVTLLSLSIGHLFNDRFEFIVDGQSLSAHRFCSRLTFTHYCHLLAHRPNTTILALGDAQWAYMFSRLWFWSWFVASVSSVCLWLSGSSDL